VRADEGVWTFDHFPSSTVQARYGFAPDGTWLGAESPEALAERLVAGTHLADVKVRENLWRGGEAAIKASDDPLIRFVRTTDPDARALRTRHEQQVEGPVTRAQEKLARARFMVYGDAVYPDATFTLRLSYGSVQGWSYQGQTIKPFTNFGGLYARATGSEPFRLPQRWLAAKSRLDPKTPFDVATSNDIIGGNSGSPLIDSRGQVVGAVFDGNIHSLGGDFGFDPRLNRAIAVLTSAIGPALREVYGLPAGRRA
jgi:Peptidase S46